MKPFDGVLLCYLSVSSTRSHADSEVLFTNYILRAHHDVCICVVLLCLLSIYPYQ